MSEVMVTSVTMRFKGQGFGVSYTRGWNEGLWETRNRLAQRIRGNYGKKVHIDIIYQAEVFYEEGTGREIRRVVY